MWILANDNKRLYDTSLYSMIDIDVTGDIVGKNKQSESWEKLEYISNSKIAIEKIKKIYERLNGKEIVS
jgi:hypothetical protein